jgi:hypothetical protein
MSVPTLGPWVVQFGGMPTDSGFSVCTQNRSAANVKVVAECWPATIVNEQHRQELFANARLIAAAPDLLEACQMLMRQIVEGDTVVFEESDSACDKIEAAIKKATGEK